MLLFFGFGLDGNLGLDARRPLLSFSSMARCASDCFLLSWTGGAFGLIILARHCPCPLFLPRWAVCISSKTAPSLLAALSGASNLYLLLARLQGERCTPHAQDPVRRLLLGLAAFYWCLVSVRQRGDGGVWGREKTYCDGNCLLQYSVTISFTMAQHAGFSTAFVYNGAAQHCGGSMGAGWWGGKEGYSSLYNKVLGIPVCFYRVQIQ